MKIAVVLLVFCVLVSIDAAPGKRFLEGFNLGGLKPCISNIVCFVSPCMMQTCQSLPGAICRQGCGCTAVWTDFSGSQITC